MEAGEQGVQACIILARLGQGRADHRRQQDKRWDQTFHAFNDRASAGAGLTQ